MQKPSRTSVGVSVSSGLLLCVVAVCLLVSCAKPMMAPPDRPMPREMKHVMPDSVPPDMVVCKSPPLLKPIEDPRDKLIREQSELLKLYEERIHQLEQKLEGTSP